MPNRNPDFADAVRRRASEKGMSLDQLGATVAAIEGRDSPYKQPTVSRWLNESVPEPEIVFAIERALDVKPGSLSKLLGYVPVNGRSGRSVLEAIDGDASISDASRRIIRATYEEARRAARDEIRRRPRRSG